MVRLSTSHQPSEAAVLAAWGRLDWLPSSLPLYLKSVVTVAGCGAIKGYESREKGSTRHGGGVWLASEIDGRHTAKALDGLDSF